MPVIWGLDLKEIQWGKFKGSYMFNQEYHLRRTKMIVYQIAMVFCVCSESVGTAALSDYVDQQDGISTRSGGLAHVHNNDIVGVMSYNIFIGIAVATIFGSGFFFDLFWPERRESRGVKLAWRASSILVSLGALADAIALTVIVARNRAYISGVDTATAAFYFEANGKPNPIYRKNAYCVASAVLLWLGVIGSFASTYIMWKSLTHNDLYGPKALRYRTKGEEVSIDMASASNEFAENRTQIAPAALANTYQNGPSNLPSLPLPQFVDHQPPVQSPSPPPEHFNSQVRIAGKGNTLKKTKP